MSIYEFIVEDITNKEVFLKHYEKKVLLIVNTASKCGFTPQFQELELLYKKYQSEGLEILGFPCNQFLNQDPRENHEINQFCKLNYGVTFPMFAKVDVNGEKEAPLFRFLKEEQQGFAGKKIKWNFTKFLVDRQGNVVDRYGPNVKPFAIEMDIKILLKT